MLHGRRHLHQSNLNLGKAMPELLEDRGKEPPRTPNEKPDGQGADFAAKGFLDIRGCPRRQGKNRLRVHQKLFSLSREADVSVTSIKQRRTQFRFEIVNLLADCRLSHVKQLRRSTKSSAFSDSDEVTQVP
jgi:hypothetical protein